MLDFCWVSVSQNVSKQPNYLVLSTLTAHYKSHIHPFILPNGYENALQACLLRGYRGFYIQNPPFNCSPRTMRMILVIEMTFSVALHFHRLRRIESHTVKCVHMPDITFWSCEDLFDSSNQLSVSVKSGCKSQHHHHDANWQWTADDFMRFNDCEYCVKCSAYKRFSWSHFILHCRCANFISFFINSFESWRQCDNLIRKMNIWLDDMAC